MPLKQGHVLRPR